MVAVVRLEKRAPEPLGLEQWLWEAACQIRGAVDAPKYKDFILPLVFLKRLSDVFEDELDELAKEYGNREVAERLVEDDHGVVRFYLPPSTTTGGWRRAYPRSSPPPRRRAMTTTYRQAAT